MPNTGQLDLFKQEVNSLPKDVPTRGVWKSLVHFLTASQERQDEIYKTVRGDGNGEKGLLRRMQVVEDAVKVIQSDVRETLNMVRAMEKLPEEEKEEDKTPERTWFINKVLPGLVQTAIISIIAVLITLIVTHYAMP